MVDCHCVPPEVRDKVPVLDYVLGVVGEVLPDHFATWVGEQAAESLDDCELFFFRPVPLRLSALHEGNAEGFTLAPPETDAGDVLVAGLQVYG